ncbi:MAG: hypothetical protein WCX65_06005 [bacterium]
MKKRFFSITVIVTLLFALIGMTATVQIARSLKIGDVLKGGAIVLATNALADPINKAINTLTMNKGVPNNASTKVVPVIALGSGTRVGFVQVSGPKNLVNKTKAVIQIETKLTIGKLDVEIFIPSDSANPLKFNRVEGIGVSALVDYRM